MKHPPSVMIWGAISTQWTAGLFFLDPGTNMNGKNIWNRWKRSWSYTWQCIIAKYLCTTGRYTIGQQSLRTFSRQKNIRLLEWPGNSPDLNPIANFWTEVKNRVAEKHPTSLPSLIKTIKSSWVLYMPTELCWNLIESMPGRIRAVPKEDIQSTECWYFVCTMDNNI